MNVSITEERIKSQIENSTGEWVQLPEKESSYLCYELSYYQPVFYCSDTDGNYYYYYSFETKPLRIVRKGKIKTAETLK